MPKIPQYFSQENLSRDTPGSRRDVQQSGILGQQIESVGSSVQGVSEGYLEAFKKADQLRQKTEAEVRAYDDFTRFSEEILSDNESDFHSLDKKLMEGLNKIYTDAGALIKDKTTKNEWGLGTELQKIKGYQSLRKELRKKQIEKGVVVLENALNQLENGYASTGDQEYITSAISKLKEFKDIGYISEKEFSRKLESINKSALFSAFNRNPDDVIEQLDKAQGFAASMGPEERESLKEKFTKIIQKQRVEQEKMGKIDEDQTEREVALGISRGEVTLEQLENFLIGSKDNFGKTHRISKKFYESSVKSLVTPFDDPKIGSEEKIKKYEEILSAYLKLDRDEDGEGPVSGMFGAASGNTLDDLKNFRALVQESTQYLTREQAKKFIDVTQNDLEEAIHPRQSGIGIIFSYANSYASRDPLIKLVDRFMSKTEGKKVTTSQAIETAKTIIEDDKTKRNPNKRFKIGEVIPTPLGPAEVVGYYEDGEPEVVLKNA